MDQHIFSMALTVVMQCKHVIYDFIWHISTVNITSWTVSIRRIGCPKHLQVIRLLYIC